MYFFQFAILGRVIEGMLVVRKIENVPVALNNKPKIHRLSLAAQYQAVWQLTLELHFPPALAACLAHRISHHAKDFPVHFPMSYTLGPSSQELEALCSPEGALR